MSEVLALVLLFAVLVLAILIPSLALAWWLRRDAERREGKKRESAPDVWDGSTREQDGPRRPA